MVSNQFPEARLIASLAALVVALAGCSSMGSAERSRSTTVAGEARTSGAEEATPAEPELTATEAAIQTGAAPASSAAPVPDGSSILNPTAPKNYTVKRGDTLWGIASLFLKDPWLWPEVWYVNPQVENPHLIYPGDVLALATGANGNPQIRLEQGGAARLNPRLRSSPLDGAIPTIPYGAIQAFLSRPTVMSADQVRNAPHVLAFRDSHKVGGSGIDIYVRDLNAAPNARFSVMHVGDALRDPDDGKVVGYQGIYTSTALVTGPGNPAKAVLVDAARETLEGDRLLSADTEIPLTFALRAPTNDVRGRIISVLDNVYLIGQYNVVVINRGKRHGVEPGNILAVDAAGEVVRDLYGGRGPGSTRMMAFAPKVKLPDERAGTLLVFRSFDRISYALVVGASTPMHVADVVRNP
jgi:LysM repeat protein